MDAKISKSNNDLLLVLFFLIIIDYILSYFGINILDIIREGNPLMVGFMKLPFTSGILIRTIIAFFIVSLFKISEGKLKDRINFRSLLVKVLMIQILPYLGHSIWIYSYLKLIYL